VRWLRRLLADFADALTAAADDHATPLALGAEGDGQIAAALETATADLTGDLDEDATSARAVRARDEP